MPLLVTANNNETHGITCLGGASEAKSNEQRSVII